MALTCPRCQGTGFRGRLGVFELLAIDDDLRALILARADGAVLRTRALAKGMKTMFQDSLAKALPCRTGNVAIISGH